MIGQIGLVLAGYSFLVWAGWLVIRKHKRKSELLLYVLITVCCAYMNIAQLLKWPQISVIQLHDLAFSGIGSWLMNRLGDY